MFIKNSLFKAKELVKLLKLYLHQLFMVSGC